MIVSENINNLESGQHPQFIFEIAKASSIRQLFGFIADKLVSFLPSVDREHIIQALYKREQLGSTAIGRGVAMPHAQLKSLLSPVALFLRSRSAVNFNAPDGKDIDLFYILLVPEESSATYLPLLSRAARILRCDEIREKLRKAKNSELSKILNEKGLLEMSHNYKNK